MASEVKSEAPPSAADRLSILLLDYQAAREDERTVVATQATMFSVALTLVGLIAAAVTTTCQFTPSGKSCTHVPDAVLGAAPLLPFAVAVFVYSIGVVGTVRSYYLRALEEELRTFAPEHFANVRHLGPASLHELTLELVSLKRGRVNYIVLLSALLAGGYVALFGLVLYIGLHVGTTSGVIMGLVYGPLLFLSISEAVMAIAGGPSLFASAVASYARQEGRSTLPVINVEPPAERGLASYLLVPRPEEVIKWLFIPAVFVVVAASLGSFQRAWDVVVLWVSTELFLYAARYQWNDLRDFVKDARHTHAEARRRLPHGNTESEARRNVTASAVTMGVRVLVAVVLGWATGLLGATLIIGALIFGIAALYEAAKGANAQRTDLRVSSLTVVVWLLVGLGYGLRAGIGASIAGLETSSGAFVLAVGALAAYGAMFVLLTWVLEATSLCFPASSSLVVAPELASRPHLAALLPSVGLRPRLDRDRREGGSSLGDQEILAARGPLVTPWNVALAGALILGNLLGVQLAGMTQSAGVLFAVIAVATLEALVLATSGSTKLRLAALLVSTIGLTGVGVAFSADRVLSLVIPTAVFGLTYVGFRSVSYEGLKYPLRQIAAGVRAIARAMLRWIVGAETYRAVGFDKVRPLG